MCLREDDKIVFPQKILVSPGIFKKTVWLPPQPFKPCRIGRRVTHGVLNVPVSEIILN